MSIAVLVNNVDTSVHKKENHCLEKWVPKKRPYEIVLLTKTIKFNDKLYKYSLSAVDTQQILKRLIILSTTLTGQAPWGIHLQFKT